MGCGRGRRVERTAVVAVAVVLAPVCVQLVGGQTAPALDSYDRNALLAFKAGGDPRDELGSWTAGDPCSSSEGWFGVWCDGTQQDYQQLVTAVSLVLMGVSGDVGDLAAIFQLRHLELRGCAGVHGSVARLASLSQLCFLDISGTAIRGPLTHLSALHGLGCTSYSTGTTGPSGAGRLDLRGTSVHGDVTELRALPGLGPSWSNFDSCADFDGCAFTPVNSTLLHRLSGNDVCACCQGAGALGTSYVRDADDASCTRDPRCSDATLQTLNCGENAFCKEGMCLCHPGWEDPPGCRLFPGGADTDTGSLRRFTHSIPTWDLAPASGPCSDDNIQAIATQPWQSTWSGVTCRAGRVVQLDIHSSSAVGSIDALAPGLSQLHTLDLSHCSNVYGDIGSLLGLIELRHVNLKRTRVIGDVAQLAPTGQLPSLELLSLNLVQTLVHGSVAPLRALPGLGRNWDGYTSCSLQHYQPSAWTRAHFAGLGHYTYDYAMRVVAEICSVLVQNATGVAGVDPCTCCLGGAGNSSVVVDGGPAQYYRNEETHECEILFTTPTPSAKDDVEVKQPRPWTGAEIRDAEPVIFVLLGLLVCGLVARVIAPAKAMSHREFVQAWWEHTIGMDDVPRAATNGRSSLGDGIAPSTNRDLAMHGGRNTATDRAPASPPSTPRPPVFAFNGGGSGGSGGIIRSGAGTERYEDTIPEDLNIEASQNPLHSGMSHNMDGGGREEDDL